MYVRRLKPSPQRLGQESGGCQDSTTTVTPYHCSLENGSQETPACGGAISRAKTGRLVRKSVERNKGFPQVSHWIARGSAILLPGSKHIHRGALWGSSLTSKIPGIYRRSSCSFPSLRCVPSSFFTVSVGVFHCVPRVQVYSKVVLCTRREYFGSKMRWTLWRPRSKSPYKVRAFLLELTSLFYFISQTCPCHRHSV